ncbi:hypothetical protein [Lysinibacillus xylanilyticus]|uniref:Uncharacterized protein n=2 Tax=Lysinibacillus xylanilyticus TaxID=582475 RepID=A0A2M9Q1M5_9BACI|nr:hypothetical protein [Lysinibacillus xylanilyticus]PJO41966.1 hypothetical protein CWD94_20825 [Lysinibacillus xylanilyticus]
MIDYMTFDVLWMDDIIANVELKPTDGGTPYVINYIEDFNKQFSPTMEGHITLEELERWLKWRTFPPTRVNAKELLASLDMQAYNRWGIVRKTHGVMADDEIWIRFKGETLTHRDVCLRKDLYYPEEPNFLEYQ